MCTDYYLLMLHTMRCCSNHFFFSMIEDGIIVFLFLTYLVKIKSTNSIMANAVKNIKHMITENMR